MLKEEDDLSSNALLLINKRGRRERNEMKGTQVVPERFWLLPLSKPGR